MTHVDLPKRKLLLRVVGAGVAGAAGAAVVAAVVGTRGSKGRGEADC